MVRAPDQRVEPFDRQRAGGFDLVTITEQAQLFLDAWDSGEFPADPNKYGVGNADLYAAPSGSPAASPAASAAA
jgi:hypothetical protein